MARTHNAEPCAMLRILVFILRVMKAFKGFTDHIFIFKNKYFLLWQQEKELKGAFVVARSPVK